MIRHILLIIILLSLATVAKAQLHFEPTTHDFRTIREADGRVSCTFRGENRGDKPIVILDIVTSCGCTVPEFSRQPILKGVATTIKVLFDPANRPGVFAKSLDVYSSDRRKIATLTIRGDVLAREQSVEEQYPIDVGSGLRLSTTLASFSYIHAGRAVQSTIGYVNTSLRTLYLTLPSEHPSGMLTINAPLKIAPNERGEVTLSYQIPATQSRYGTISDALAVTINGQTTGKVLVAHAIGVDPPRKDEEFAPKIELSENIVKFGAVKRANSPRRLPFTLTNVGDAELIVRAVESEGRFSTTLRVGQRIPAGGRVDVEVALDPRGQEYGILSDHLVIITNDPWRPMRRLRVTAIIED